MAKKLLGERQIGEKVYEAGTILTDEDFAASGLKDSDVVNVAGQASAPAAQETAAAPKDADADLDAQASGGNADEQKKEGEQSSSTGADSSAAGGEGGASSSGDTATGEEPTVEHILTEQDLIDNADLAAQGLTVGSTVRLPAVEKILTEEDLAADASWTEKGHTVGDKVLVAKE